MRAKTRTTIASALTSTALATALLTGCGSDGATSASSSMPNVEPAPSGSTSSPSSSASPSASSSPSTSKKSTSGGSVEMAGAPGVPKKAQKHSKAGAKAFGRYYVHLVNETGVNPERGRLDRLGEPGCESCENYAGNVDYLVSHKQHNDGDAARIHRTAARQLSASSARTWVLIDQLPIQVLDANGNPVRSMKRIQDVALVFDLRWHDNRGWRVQEIQVDQSGHIPS